VDALVACDHVNQWTDWGVPGLLTKLELWNGAGYYLHGHPSPYIWASTDQYGPPHALAGKYVRDSEFDPNAIDTQLGCAAMLARLFAQDSDVRSQFGQGLPPVHPAMIAPPAPAQAAADRGTEWQQAALNRLSTIEPYETAMANAMQGTGLSLPLDVDGDYGRSTKQATRGFQRAAGVFDDGKCGPVTSAAIAAALAANPAKT
jgi:peptidoglycan hydrolase-like protein with peptidoglycan-binding domain